MFNQINNNILISGDIGKIFKVRTFSEWLSLAYKGIEEKTLWDEYANKEECQIAKNILTLNVSYYLLRRTPHCDGSIVDTCLKMICSLENRYKELTGKVFDDFNDEIDY